MWFFVSGFLLRQDFEDPVARVNSSSLYGQVMQHCEQTTAHLAPHLSVLGITGFPGGASDKEPACQFRSHKRRGFDLWARKIPWRRKWQLTPVFLPGEPHGQRSLAGYSPWGHKVSDTTDAT